jgi:hypothetical protein
VVSVAERPSQRRAGELCAGHRGGSSGVHPIDEQLGEEDLVEQPPGWSVGEPVGPLAVGSQIERQLDDALPLRVLALDYGERPARVLEFARDPGLLLVEQFVADLVAVEQVQQLLLIGLEPVDPGLLATEGVLAPAPDGVEVVGQARLYFSPVTRSPPSSTYW